MAISRSQLSTSFWTDEKVREEFTPEDRLFYVYLLTSPQSTITGCYTVSFSQMVIDTGLSKETIKKLLHRLQMIHHVIAYNGINNEVLIRNWGRYNWTDSEDFRKGVVNAAAEIKTYDFRNYVLRQIGSSTPTDAPEAPVKAADPKENANRVPDEIIEFMNKLAGKRFRKIESNRKGIRARLEDGYTEMDAYNVVKRKWAEWKGTEWEKYFCPETLFRPGNFEKYVNAPATSPAAKPDKYANARRMYKEFHNEEG